MSQRGGVPFIARHSQHYAGQAVPHLPYDAVNQVSQISETGMLAFPTGTLTRSNSSNGDVVDDGARDD